MKKILKPFPLTDEDHKNQISIPFTGGLMYCTVCSDLISVARLDAMPGATKCIVCASVNDAPMIRRYDDHSEVNYTECYFTSNSMIESEIERLRVDRKSTRLNS